MELGLHYWNFSRPAAPELIASTLAETARLADEGGLSSFTPMDHYFQMEHRNGGPSEPMLEGYTTLGFVAAQTKRISLGLLVTGVTYRHPGLLAKIVATLDVLSGGRAFFGIGAGWYEREHLGLGVPVAPGAERFERLEEAIQICLQMWSDDNGPYRGRHYQLEETLCVPAPLGGRRPMVMIGGGGETKTLRLVARYGDACNVFARSVEEVTHKLDVLRAHCDTEGTDFDAIRKTVMYSRGPLRDTNTFLTEAELYAAMGVAEIQILPDRHPVEFTEQVLTTLLPRISALP